MLLFTVFSIIFITNIKEVKAISNELGFDIGVRANMSNENKDDMFISEVMYDYYWDAIREFVYDSMRADKHQSGNFIVFRPDKNDIERTYLIFGGVNGLTLRAEGTSGGDFGGNMTLHIDGAVKGYVFYGMPDFGNTNMQRLENPSQVGMTYISGDIPQIKIEIATNAFTYQNNVDGKNETFNIYQSINDYISNYQEQITKISQAIYSPNTDDADMNMLEIPVYIYGDKYNEWRFMEMKNNGYTARWNYSTSSTVYRNEQPLLYMYGTWSDIPTYEARSVSISSFARNPLSSSWISYWGTYDKSDGTLAQTTFDLDMESRGYILNPNTYNVLLSETVNPIFTGWQYVSIKNTLTENVDISLVETTGQYAYRVMDGVWGVPIESVDTFGLVDGTVQPLTTITLKPNQELNFNPIESVDKPSIEIFMPDMLTYTNTFFTPDTVTEEGGGQIIIDAPINPNAPEEPTPTYPSYIEKSNGDGTYQMINVPQGYIMYVFPLTDEKIKFGVWHQIYLKRYNVQNLLLEQGFINNGLNLLIYEDFTADLIGTNDYIVISNPDNVVSAQQIGDYKGFNIQLYDGTYSYYEVKPYNYGGSIEIPDGNGGTTTVVVDGETTVFDDLDTPNLADIDMDTIKGTVTGIAETISGTTTMFGAILSPMFQNDKITNAFVTVILMSGAFMIIKFILGR
jgi:hypothetical protein